MAYPTKKQAQERADALVSRLHGTGWQTRVWENNGWHCRAFNGHVSVVPVVLFGLRTETFGAFISESVNGINTPGHWLTVERHQDPNDAIRAAVAKLKQVRDQADGILKAIEVTGVQQESLSVSG